MFMFWDKICSNETNIEKYHKLCHEQGTNLVVCHKCDQRFTNFALWRHNHMCHTKPEFECGMVFNTDDTVESHYNRKHKMKPLLSREMCYHWKKGACEDDWVMVAVLVKNIP